MNTIQRNAFPGLPDILQPSAAQREPAFEHEVYAGSAYQPAFSMRTLFHRTKQTEIQSFVSDLDSRLSRDPMSISPGDYVAVVASAGKQREVYLMKIVGVEDLAGGRMVTYHGGSFGVAENGSRVGLFPDGEKLHARFLAKTDRIVPLRPEEFREFCSVTRFFGRGAGSLLGEIDGAAEQLFASFLRSKKNVIIVGNVAV